MLIFKASAEHDRLEALLSRQEAKVRRAFARFLTDATSDDVIKEVADLIEAGNIDGAMRIVDGYVVRLGAVIPTIFADTASSEIDALAQQLEGARVAIAFDPTNPIAAAAMRQERLEFIREFTDAQRAATREALATAMGEGAGAEEASRSFRDSIGLTQRQLQAVANYRRLLETGSAEALQRDLRDRRYDASVRGAVESGEPLDASQIDSMVERYRQRMLMYRAENIARTDAGRVYARGREEALRQTLDQTGIDTGQVERRWLATRDSRTRDTHRLMNGQVVNGLDTPFQSPSGAMIRYPRDPNAPAAETINCRCVVVNRIRKTTETAS